MTHIGRSVVIDGEFISDEDLHIEGTVKGDLQIRDATLTIGEPAKIEAETVSSIAAMTSVFMSVLRIFECGGRVTCKQKVTDAVVTCIVQVKSAFSGHASLNRAPFIVSHRQHSRSPGRPLDTACRA